MIELIQKNRILISLTFVLFILFGCEEDDVVDENQKYLSSDGFFVFNEGAYLAGNGSATFYSYDSLKSYNNLFFKANGRPLGDVVHSATASSGMMSIVVNNSGKIEVVSMADMKSAGTISNLISPRYIGIIGHNKAYVTSLYSDSVIIIDPGSNSIKGYIDLGASSEFIMISGQYAYVSNWSGGRTASILNTETDEVIEIIQLASEPGNIVIDSNGFFWVLCNGGYRNEEYPALYKLSPVSGAIIREYVFGYLTDSPTELCIDNTGSNIYFINKDIYRMSIADQQLPDNPFIEAGERYYYSMDIDPIRGTILVSDPIDFMQSGYVYGFSESGEELFSFLAGIIPGSFCFKNY